MHLLKEMILTTNYFKTCPFIHTAPFSLRLMKSGVHTIIQRKQRIFSAVFYALAFLVLVISCPLKKAVSHPGANTGSRIVNTAFYTGGAVQKSAQADCCLQKDKFSNALNNTKKGKEPLPASFIPDTFAPGFEISYFLSGTESFRSSSQTLISDLPLFLQIRRLLL